jgi:hypothetical protein
MWHIISDPLQNLNYLCKDSESIEILAKIQDQVDVLQQSTELVSSSAEVRTDHRDEQFKHYFQGWLSILKKKLRTCGMG